MFNFDEASKSSKEAIEGMLRSYSEIAKGFQAIATEASDFSRRSFQDMTSHLEALYAVRSVETIYELQSSYAKSACEGFVSEAGKIGDMYVDLAKTAFQPYEAPVAKLASVVKAKAA